MKVKIVKCSGKHYWYSKLELPMTFYVSDKVVNGKYYETNNQNIDIYANSLIECEDCIIENDTARVFTTGAKRDSDHDKPYVHNLQGYTRLRFGYLTRMGAQKYGDGNFLKGFPKEDAIKSLDRHLARYLDGDKSEDHLAAIIFNTQLIMLEEKREGMAANHYFKEEK